MNYLAFGWTTSRGAFLECRPPFPIIPVFGVKLGFADGSGLRFKPYCGLRAEFMSGTEVDATLDTDKKWTAEIGLTTSVLSGTGRITGQGLSITGASVDPWPMSSCTWSLKEENPASVQSVSSPESSPQKRKRNTDDVGDPEPNACKKVCRPAGQSQEKL